MKKIDQKRIKLDKIQPNNPVTTMADMLGPDRDEPQYKIEDIVDK